MGWEPPAFIGDPGTQTKGGFINLIRLMERGDEKHLIESQEHAEEFMWGNWLPLEEWKKSLEKPEITRRLRQVNERWAKLAVMGSNVYSNTFRGIPDPILLIDGKYVITANTMRRHGGNEIKNVFLTANWIIREQLKKNPKYGFKSDNIRWEKGRHATAKELLITYRVPWKGTVPQRVRIPPGKLSLQPVAIGAGDGGNDIVRSTSV